MSGTLLHTQAKILQKALVSLGLGVEPASGNPWPVFAPFEPDTPDNCITAQSTTGDESGWDIRIGEMHERYGAQVRVRSNDYDTGFVKANAIFDGINKSPGYLTVSLEGISYCIQSMYCAGPLIDMSKERTGGNWDLFFINVLMTVDKS